MLPKALVSLCLAGFTLSSSLPNCELLNIPVTISNIQQKNLTGPIDFTTYDGTYNSFPNTTISGTYSISASFCQPAKETFCRRNRTNSLQVLVHGGNYNKTYWSALQTPPASHNDRTYSWVDYVTSQGYSVLAIDRLCNGNSSHPDASDVCQLPLEAAVIHALAQKARAGGTFGSRPFTSIIYIGHSLGSALGAYYADSYPSDLNATILTAFSAFAGPGASGLLLATGWQPARDAYRRYTSLQPTYLTFTDQRTAQGAFYHGQFDQAIADLDFQGVGTAAYGELQSFTVLSPRPNVKIPVMLINGQQDEISCARTATANYYGTGGDCTGLTDASKTLFPNAASFSSYNVPDTGHCINLHYSAPLAMQAAQEFLGAAGL